MPRPPPAPQCTPTAPKSGGAVPRGFFVHWGPKKNAWLSKSKTLDQLLLPWAGPISKSGEGGPQSKPMPRSHLQQNDQKNQSQFWKNIKISMRKGEYNKRRIRWLLQNKS